MSNNKRTGKFYRKNEQEVMESLGFKPTPNSGSGWLIKEDGQNEHAICQLKSTDASSIKINQKDIEVLEYNALVSHKIPVFAIQFLNTNEVFLLVRPEDLENVSRIIKDKEPIINRLGFLGFDMESQEAQGGISDGDLKPERDKKTVIKSSANSRKSFMKENDERYKKKSMSAK